MGDEIRDTPVGGETRAPDAVSPPVESDPGDASVPPEGPRLHMTGRGLSPAEYQAQHGSHDHQADFTHGPGQGSRQAADHNEKGSPGQGRAGRERHGSRHRS